MDQSWIAKIGGIVRSVRTPLSLGGLAVIVLCVIYNRILGLGIFSIIDASQTSSLLTTMMDYVFGLALVAVVLGIMGFLIRPNSARSG